jgi:hypothetical protein
LLGTGPAALIGYALWASRAEKIFGTTSALQHVQRVAVVAQRRGNESVVARIVHRRMQVAVELEDVQFLVVLKLVAFRPWGSR